MWCRECQQDVPAVARSAAGPLVCTRCETEFESEIQADESATHLVDTGVALDGFDQGRLASPSSSPWETGEAEDRLRQIGRQLRTGYRHQIAQASKSAPPHVWGSAALAPLAQEQRLRSMRRKSKVEVGQDAQPTLVSRLISLVLVLGVIGFVGGVVSLVWSAGFGLPKMWQWGMTATIAAEGTLIVGLTWMAVRLWHNGRQLNRQIDGVDRQLVELEQLAGSLAASGMSASQNYYSHFNRGASEHMLLANLRGQMDQLSTRLAG